MIKFYKNPERNSPSEFQNYEPQYKKLKVQPIGAAPPTSPQFLVSRGSTDNPRMRAVPTIQNVPFAETVPANQFPIGHGPVPNIGNNIEHTWAGVDGEIVDDLELTDSNEFIDNNDFVDTESIAQSSYIEEETKISANEELTALDTNDLGDYSLLLLGQFHASGSLEEIETEVKSLLYGDHSLCKEIHFTVEDLTILKKVPIKIGIFISEN